MVPSVTTIGVVQVKAVTAVLQTYGNSTFGLKKTRKNNFLHNYNYQSLSHTRKGLVFLDEK